MSDLLTDAPVESASEAGGSAAEAAPQTWACPECRYSGQSEVALKIHWRKVHKGLEEPQWTEKPQRRIEEAAPPPRADVGPPPAAETRTPKEIEAIRAGTEKSLDTIAGVLFLFGLQTSGVVLGNRAKRISFQAITYAQSNEPFMRLLIGFNAVMAAGEVAELGTELAMGVGVDLGVLHPAKPVRLGPVNVPGFMFLRPIAGDLDQVAQIRDQSQAMQAQYEREMAAAAAPNGRPDATAG